tara:strand:- start:426 stop:656 length:231 start_codon:yes stop_codon:yes gene_type:complete
MISHSSRFSSDDTDERYQRAVHNIFDYVRHVGFEEGLTLEELLGVMTVCRGSLELNLALSNLRKKLEEKESEEDDE